MFAKKLMRHADVPTAEFRIFDHPDPARHYIETREYPVVVKADGLAAGKGVVVCSTKEEALAAIDRIMVREEFGREAGRQGGRRETAGGRGVEHPGPGVGPDHRAAAADAGPQGGLRRRYGTEHRRHGRLLPCPAGSAGPARRRGARRAGADRPRHEARPTAVPRRPLRRSHDDAAGAARAGVQLPLRRSGNAAAADAAADRPAGRAGGGGRGPAGRVAEGAGMGPAAGGVRGDGGEGLSRQVRARLADHGPGGGGAAAGREGVPRRHAARRRPCADRRRPRPRRDGAGRHARRRQAAGV